MKDEVVAQLDLREEQPVLATGLPPLLLGEERGEASQPFAAAAREVFGAQGVGQGLETLGCATPQKRIRALFEVDVLLAHAVGQPVMLIETDPGGKREIRAHAHEYPAPAWVVDVEVVLHDPALGDLQVPAVRLLVADGGHDPGRLSGLEDDDDPVGPCALEVRLDKFVTPALWCLNNRGAPAFGLVLDPGLKLFGGIAQQVAADRIDVSVAVEEADHALGLLKWLDQPVEQDPVKAAVREADAVLVVLVEGVHHRLPDPSRQDDPRR